MDGKSLVGCYMLTHIAAHKAFLVRVDSMIRETGDGYDVLLFWIKWFLLLVENELLSMLKICMAQVITSNSIEYNGKLYILNQIPSLKNKDSLLPGVNKAIAFIQPHSLLSGSVS